MPVPDEIGPDVELTENKKLDLGVAGPGLLETLNILEKDCVIAGGALLELDLSDDKSSDVTEDILLESPLGLPIPGHSDTVDNQS